MNLFPRLAILSLVLLVGLQAEVQAEPDDGYWFLDFNSRSGAALNSLSVGIDSGSGFVYSTLTDDDNDGVIHLPPVPNNGGLALGVDGGVGDVGCDLWDLVGAQVSGDVGTSISRPLLIIAEDVEGEALGMDSSPFSFPLPPTRTLVPGERLTATGGQLAEWPDLRLVAAGATVTTLEEYLQQVDTLPLYTGEVIVTNFLLTGTFILSGDGNGDGWVDGLDYLLWADAYGTHPGPDGDISDGDYNDDGWVDGLDYLLWAGNYGSHSAASVPEPSAVVMMLVGMAIVGIDRRGRFR